MRILVLHSDVPPDAPPEEIDTLTSAEAVAQALLKHGHDAFKAAFTTDQDRFAKLMEDARADVVFNLVEGVDGLGHLAPIAPRMLDDVGAIYTGVDAIAMAVTSDKPLTKRKMREAGIATADWYEPPDWRGLKDGKYIVKSTLEDASVGLDDGCVVTGVEAVKRRAADSTLRHGGRWFAEQYVDGREFNISMMQGPDGPIVMPLAEMRFDDWPEGKPRIVGYGAKWDETLDVNDQMVRAFDTQKNDPILAAKLHSACERVWKLFGFTGYVRVDIRVTPEGEPLILEINTNPCIAPDAGFAAAGAEAGIPYDQLIMKLVDTALQSAR
jgi:D-alanine-D-alanine ligase